MLTGRGERRPFHLITENTAVVAPMPSASVLSAAAANAGLRRIDAVA